MASLDNQGLWSDTDILMLLERMKHIIGSDDFREFESSQADIDWSKVAFGLFSGEMCKQKWLEISGTLRKFRTLTALVPEAKDMKKPHKNNTNKEEPDRPKRPLTAYLRFYKEQRPKYCQMYPNYRNAQLTRLLAEKYHQLPAEIKQRYIQDFKKDKQDFQEMMRQFKKRCSVSGHPKKSVLPRSHQTKVSKKSQGDRKTTKSLQKAGCAKTFSSDVKFQREPRKPPMNAYHKFHQDSWSSPELRHLSFRERWVEISRLWQRVPKHQKEHYGKQAEKLQEQYFVDLDLWLKTLSPEEYAAYKEAKANCGKGKNMSMSGGTSHKFGRTDDLQSSSKKRLHIKPGEELIDPGSDSSESTRVHHGSSQASRQDMVDDSDEEDSSTCSVSTTSSDSSSTGVEDENLPHWDPEL